VIPADAWVPVKLRWRHVRAGDVFFSPKTNDLWMVSAALDRDDRPARAIVVTHGAAVHEAEVDLDETVTVLVPVPERDALRVCRDELGARLVARE
jgi:hypothetical protein